MLICPGCARHVLPAEPVCPFCGDALRSDEAPRPQAAFGVAVAAVICLGLGVACGPGSDNTTGTTAGMSADPTTSPVPTSTSPSSSTSTSPGTSTATATTTTANTSETSAGPTDTAGTTEDDYTDPCAFYAGCPPEDFFDDSPCDVWSQDCPEGEKCAPYDESGDDVWDAVQCVPVDAEPDAVGEACIYESIQSGVDTCEAGAICWGVEPGTQDGTCVAQCTGTPQNPSCPPSASCVIANDGALTLCLPICDPLIMDCDDGQLCVNNPDDEDSFVCVFAGDTLGGEDDVCEFINACEPGLACLLNGDGLPDCEGGACCTPFCDLNEPDTCAAPKACTPYFDDPPPNYEHYGVCIVP